jgi:regulator of protease activity HflC (stomatin/prohibitin superfamily)
MEAAFAWLGQSVEWFGKFIPRWVILDTTMGMVKFVKGQPVACAPGGVYWYWPVTTTIKEVPAVRQADDLRTQTVVTADDKVIIVGGMLVSEITDLVQFVASSYDGPTTIVEMGMAAIHDVCCRLTWEELKAMQRKGTLDTRLKNAAKEQLTEYGVNVLKVMLTDMAPTKALRLVQSNQEG